MEEKGGELSTGLNPNNKPSTKRQQVAEYMRLAAMGPDEVKKTIHEKITTESDGAKLGKTFSESVLYQKPIDLSNTKLGLGERVSDQISRLKKRERNPGKVAEILFRDLDNFKSGGIDDVFASPKEPSPESGKTREANIDHVVSIKSALLELAKGSFVAGNVETSFGILGKYGIGDSFKDDPNLPRVITENSRYINLKNPSEKEAIISFAEAVSKLPDVGLGQSFYDKVQKARERPQIRQSNETINEVKPVTEIDQKPVEVAKDIEKLPENPKEFFEITTGDGKKILTDFFEEPYPSIRGFGEGIELNQLLISEGLNGEGIFKYLDFLKKHIDNPQLLDKYAQEISEKYGLAVDLLKERLLTEIHGNVYGILIGAVEYNGQKMSEGDRRKIIEETIKILGQGRFYNGILMDDEQISSTQTLVKEALNEYIDKAGKESRIRRLDGWAALIDEDMAREVASVKNEKQKKPEIDVVVNPKIESLSDDELVGRLKDSSNHLEIINKIEKETPDIVTKAERVNELYNDPLNWQNYILVQFIEKDKKIVHIGINISALSDISVLIEQEKQELAQNPNDKLTSEAILRNEVDRDLLDKYLFELIKKVNDDSFKTTSEEKGFLGIKKTVPAVFSDAFDNQPLPKEGDMVWSNPKFDIDAGLVSIKESKPDGQGKNWSLADLQREIETLRNEPNVSNVANRIIQVEKLLDERENMAQRFIRSLKDRVDRSISNLAVDYVYNRLKNFLVEENRVVKRP